MYRPRIAGRHSTCVYGGCFGRGRPWRGRRRDVVVAATQLAQGEWTADAAAAFAQDRDVTEALPQVLLLPFGVGVPVGQDVEQVPPLALSGPDTCTCAVIVRESKIVEWGLIPAASSGPSSATTSGPSMIGWQADLAPPDRRLRSPAGEADRLRSPPIALSERAWGLLPQTDATAPIDELVGPAASADGPTHGPGGATTSCRTGARTSCCNQGVGAGLL